MTGIDYRRLRGGIGFHRSVFSLLLAISFAGCALFRSAPPPPLPPPPAPAEIKPPAVMGVASWYGPGFNGHRTSDGEVYDQNDLTAASTVYPIGCRVMVTNLNNGRAVEVRINDHGPFVKGRKIDLSHRAASVLGIIGTGTAPVRIDLVSAPVGARTVGAPTRYWVQVGSFANRSNAAQLQRRLAQRYSDVRLDKLEAGRRRYYRVRMGAFATRDEAQTRASDSTRFGLPIVIVSE
ncbi:MAG TPA: septal ring lytic transglycosylase RlpA family protein [Candidatus Binataceae bacterium]